MAGREFHDGAKDGFGGTKAPDPEKIHSLRNCWKRGWKTAFGGVASARPTKRSPR